MTGEESAILLFLMIAMLILGMIIGHSIEQIKKANKNLDTLSEADKHLQDAEEFRKKASEHLNKCKELADELSERIENGT